MRFCLLEGGGMNFLAIFLVLALIVSEAMVPISVLAKKHPRDSHWKTQMQPSFSKDDEQSWKAEMESAESALQDLRTDEAKSSYISALTLAEKFGSADPRLAMTLNKLADFEFQRGNYKDAAVNYERLVNICSESKKSPEAASVDALMRLGDCFNSIKRDKAGGCYRRALSIQENIQPPDDLRTAVVLKSLGGWEAGQQNFHEAESLYKRAVTIYESKPDAANLLSATLSEYANLLQSAGKKEEAKEARERAQAVTDKVTSHNN